MKNLFNFNQLFMSWNEKQKPRRIGRYAAILIMLLTLGVGQMWAYSYTIYCVPKALYGNGWTEGSSKIKIWYKTNYSNTSYDKYMTKTAYTYNGNYIYSATMDNLTGEGADWLYFQKFTSSGGWDDSGSGYKIFESWWGQSGFAGKMFKGDWSGSTPVWVDYKVDHTISASSTIVWDMAGNSKSWAASYLYRDVNGGEGANDAMTRIGTTSQWYKTYGSASNYIASFLFRANNSNWNDYTHTTNIERNVSGVTLFTWDNTDNSGSPKKLNWQITENAKKATSGTKIYLDKTDATGWGEVWLKYGTQWFNRSSAAAATLVTGTDALYVITMPNDAYYEKYVLADNYGYTNYNNITNDGNLKHRIAHQASNLSSDITYIPTSTASGKGTSGNPYVWNYSTLSGHTRTLTISAPSNGSISATYTDESGTEQTVTSGSFAVAQTCKVTITATPNDGYALSALTLGGNSITSGAEQIIRADGTIAATFVAETTYSITVSHKCGSRTFDTEVLSVGVTTPRNISSQTIDGFSFSSWSNLTNVTNHSANLTTDPISITSTAAGSMTCNYTQWPCSLDINTTSGNTGYTSRVAMTYDATAKAYYKEFTTTAATQYFRFYINSKKYAPSSDTEVVISGTKVTAATDVTDYASNMPSVYFNDGGTGSKIKVWFDYEKKKAWVEEVKYTVTIASGGNGTVSPTSVSVGNVVASGTITATASDHYHWSSWDVPSGVTIVSGSGTKDITIKATAAGTLTANFAGDQYTISYKDQGNVSYSGSNLASLPTTHTYGSATALVNGSKTGYDFVGWYTDAACTSSAGSSIGATAKTANFTLYAKWSAKNYTATNNLQDAAGNAGQYNVYYDGTSIAHTSAPSRSGYTIEGYYKEAGWSNKIANTDLSLVSSNTTYTTGGKWTYTSAPNLHIKWQQTLTLAGNGTGSTDGSLTMTYGSRTTTSHTPATRTGYTLAGYYTATSGGYKVINANGSLVSYSSDVSSYLSNSAGNWIYNGTPTLSAQWTAKNYTLTFAPNGGTVDPTSASVTYDAAISNAPIPTKTGYTFTGYNTAGGTSITTNAGVFKSSVAGFTDASAHWVKAADATITAQWSANTYNVVFNKNDEGATGTMSNQVLTYDAEATALTSNAFAKNGYAFAGWATSSERAAAGTVDYTDGQSVSNLTSTASGTFNLYAVWTQVTLTDLTFSPAQAAPGATVTATPVLSGTPTGNSVVCWGLYYDAECNSAVPGATFTSNPSSGSNAVTFTAPATSGTYYVQGIYRAGTTCDGTEHNTYVEAYTLASAHTATIKYVCGGTEISARGSVTIPAGDSVKIGPKEIIGYTFSSWSADPVITLGSRDGDSVKVGATYDGIITATYTRANMILFKDELGWTDPEDDDAHVYLNLLTASRWDFSNSKGSGNKDVTNRNLEMNRLPGTTDVFYYLYENKTFTHVSFTDRECIGAGSAGQEYFWSNDAQDADKVKVVYPTVPLASTATADSTVYGFNAGTPMFVPLASQDGVKRNNNDGGAAMYYNKGYWRWYDPYITDTTGYSLLFYSGPNSGSRSLEKTVAFTDATGDDIFETTVNLEAQTTYYIKFLRDNSLYYTKANSTLSNDEYQEFTQNPENYATANFKSSAAGDYIFRITIGSNGRLKMKVVYPAKQGDYRVVYKDLATWSQGSAHTASWCHPSRPVHKEANAKDIVSFYVSKAVSANASMKFQYASAINAGTGAITWTDVTGGSIDISSITESGVYNFYLTQDENGDISVSDIKPYTGSYYIRTNSVTGKWSDYKNSDHLMPYSDYSFKQDKDPYSHYLTQWVTSGTSISFTVANDYSSCISDTLIQGVSKQKDAAYDITNASTGVISSNANVRFMYNQSTNKLSRAYISGSTNISDRFLVLEGSAKMYDADGNALSISGLSANQMNFTDKQNWIYEATVKANPGANVKLTAKFNNIIQYLKGGNDGTASDSVALLGGTGTGKYKVQVVYDFKINRLVTAWMPDNNEVISDSLKINADVMIVRNHQENPDAITFSQPDGKGYGALTDVKTVYGVMTFNRWTLNNRAHPEDVAVAHCAKEESTDNWVFNKDTTDKYHPVLTEGNQKSIYERCHYYISFPFDVKLSDVFGFGTYWDEWYLEYYDGKARAKNGYWIDSKPNWKYVTTAMKNDFVMKAYEGYILGLDLDFMAYNNTDFWSANSSEVSLYFPSTGTIDTISHNSVTVHIDTVGYTCTINRGTDEGDRRIKDSHWHCIGVPSYAALAHAVQTSDLVVDWSTQTVPYVYNWNMTDNTLTPVSASGSSSFTFQPMHAYLVQYAKPELTWSAAATTPIHSVVARSEENDVLRECEFRLELQQNDAMTDQTYIRLTTDEAVTTGFEFNYDLVKELNGKRSNIYTLIGYEKAAANMLPFTEQTTVVPVGVKIVADGEYTFSIPDGTSGVGVTLIDNVLNTRTNLGLMDYTVNLEAGTIDGRFMIEISPVQGATTGIENSEVSGQDSDVRKVIIDQKMYIIKGDRIYDATGAMVK